MGIICVIQLLRQRHHRLRRNWVGNAEPIDLMKEFCKLLIGAFRNPPVQVAGIFDELLRGGYRETFAEVKFVIKDRPDMPNQNFEIFQEIIGAVAGGRAQQMGASGPRAQAP